MNLLIALPKSGTHLFGSMIQADQNVVCMKREPQTTPLDQFLPAVEIVPLFDNLNPKKNYKGHIPWHTETEEKIKQFDKVVLLLRDPRDVIISMAYYAGNHPSTAMNYQIAHRHLSDFSLEWRIDWLIENMNPVFSMFDRWRNVYNIHTFIYEDLFLNRGIVFLKLSELGFGTITEIDSRSQHRLFTYRSGSFDNWKTELNDDQERRAARLFGKYIEAWKPQGKAE